MQFYPNKTSHLCHLYLDHKTDKVDINQIIRENRNLNVKQDNI